MTERVDLHSLLKSRAAPKAPSAQEPRESPRCGLLTKTVVESPLVNSILPVRLRSAENNDIAFVGVGVPCLQSPLFTPSPQRACLSRGRFAVWLTLTLARTILFKYASSERMVV